MNTKAQLIEKGEHYFQDKNVNLMYATSDGNFFFESSKNYADSHAKTKNIELFTITRSDLVKVKEEPKVEKVKTKESKVEEEPKKEEIPIEAEEVDEDALMAKYKEETGKNAIYRDKITKGYLNWKSE